MTTSISESYMSPNDLLMNAESKMEGVVDTLTPIQHFYQGKNIFITGATGFLGKLVVEKLLWSCPGIGKIYLLMRNKKGKSVQSRIEELTDSVAFSRVKKDIPGYKGKIKTVSGDCSLPGLGLSESDRNLLIKEVNVIFHVAATVRFNEPLAYATAVNIRATIEIVSLAKQFNKLDSLIHVSTAYANCYMTKLEEKIYETPVDAITLLNFVESCDPKILEDITPKLLSKWPNTYTFTKCLTEQYYQKHTAGLPIGIFRPSIVISSLREPLPGWVDNWYGLSGFITATAMGFLRVARAHKDGIPNLVPVDFCVNGLIAAGWEVGMKFAERQNAAENLSKNEMQIYNFVMADQKITWSELYDTTATYGQRNPPIQALWYRCFFLQSYESVYKIQRFLLHHIPACLADAVFFCMGKKMMFRALYKRIHLMQETVTFFTLQDWEFSNHNIPLLIDSMSEEDRKLYPCDMRTIHWKEFCKTYFLGTRRYLMKDDDSTIPEARKKYLKLYILHRIVQLVLLYLFVKFIYHLYTFTTSFV